ncbi:hypothetical protein BCR32DRAFT_284282 [Anaeromyces robustus]|uniref:Uncharacterized protein n=1 Tax=Anaeromyces robustus TaxID=1754192 RepID=A0A1Y1WS11_9FUNG|nr:hypothetical protein BCR32DRAFT_284282 [Anaeromyces robustus]|eukprot:ORX76329.1 hypothetical protein BCR32DRAFT_284282 [Anaeromyces robustus]
MDLKLYCSGYNHTPTDFVIQRLSEAYIKEQNNLEYSECTEEVTHNYKQVYSSFKSKKRQRFYKYLLDYFPICKNYPTIKDYYQSNLMEYSVINKKLTCLTDKKNNLCPFGIAIISEVNDNNYSKYLSNENLSDECRSLQFTNDADTIKK